MKIKYLILLLIMGLGLLSGCKSNDDTELELEFESSAIILGFDMALCPCCGGWIINIDDQELANRFSELPQDSNINLENALFPISVKLNWSESNAFCGIGIIIESIELIE